MIAVEAPSWQTLENIVKPYNEKTKDETTLSYVNDLLGKMRTQHTSRIKENQNTETDTEVKTSVETGEFLPRSGSRYADARRKEQRSLK